MRKELMIFLALALGIQADAYGDVLTVGHTAGFDYKTITHAMAAASR